MSSGGVKTFTVFLFIVVPTFPFIIGSSNEGTYTRFTHYVNVCRINDARNTVGVCKPLTDCPAVLGLLRAGVKPTSCSLQGPAMVCCPSKKRISTEKCDEFMKILTQPIKNKQALSFDGNHSDYKTEDGTIKCESFLYVFISGGTNAKLRQFPYQVALGYGEKPDWRCGGTLIDPSYVLTAGHCVRTIYGPPKVILMGDRRLSTMKDSSRLLVNVKEIYVYPKYQPPLQYNDIAIIKLEHPVKLSRAILPACLPNPSDRLDRMIGVEATGWGRTGAFDEQSDVLKTVTLAKFSTEECVSFFHDQDSTNNERLPKGIIRSQFCAGDKHGLRDTCQGDSGGPVTVEHKDYSCVRYLVGITSFGSSLCGYQQPGVYTNVISYLDWIEDVVWRNLSTSEKSKLYTKIRSHDQEDGLTLNPTDFGHNSIPETDTTPTQHKTQATTTPMTSTETVKPLLMHFPTNTPSVSTDSTTQHSFITPHSMPTSEPTDHRIVSDNLSPFQQLNQEYNFFNISSTLADLLNKFSIGR